MNKPLVLVVEDDRPIRNLIVTTLKAHDYHYLTAENGHSAIIEATSHNPDIVLLDLGLPDIDGTQVIESIRSWSNMPIIVISARSEDKDKITALDAGADDYVVKPFSPRELIARLRAVLRRGAAEAEKTIVCGPVALNESRFSAKVNGVDVRLGVIEFKMLCVLAANPGRVYSRAQLLERVWDDAAGFDERTVDVHVLRLRKQLAGTAAADIVDTVRGLGYRARA